jgi:hypothetical protein
MNDRESHRAVVYEISRRIGERISTHPKNL